MKTSLTEIVVNITLLNNTFSAKKTADEYRPGMVQNYYIEYLITDKFKNTLTISSSTTSVEAKKNLGPTPSNAYLRYPFSLDKSYIKIGTIR